MKTKEIKVSITVRASKETVDQSDEPYFYKVGFEKEDEVTRNEVENGVESWFEGFEILPNGRSSGRDSQEQDDEEQIVVAKLYYNVLVEIR